MEAPENGPKRIIPSTKTPTVRREDGSVTIIPSIDTVLGDSLFILEADLAKYRAKVRAGKALELAEARIVQGHLKCLVEVARIQREMDKDQDLSKLTPEQLLELAATLVEQANKAKG
jgi:hypothetical protein